MPSSLWITALVAALLTCQVQAQTAGPAASDAPATIELGDEPPAEAAADDGETVSIEEIRRFVSVFRAVKQAYVDPVDDATLMRSAIRGLLGDLDPHSAYLDAEETDWLTEQTNGAYDGLGVEVVQQPDRSLLVIAPIDGTPAARAGILPGDLIVAIDGQPIAGGNVEAAVTSMRGEPGSQIELTIVRESLGEPLTMSLTREKIEVSSVRTLTLEPGYGYLRISHFQAETAREARRKLDQLIAADAGLRGLVLDLRSNPGGLMNSAVESADLFLEPGVVVTTRGRLPFSISESRAGADDMLDGAPIVVLVDSGTASAAEVLAAALRDQRRALLIGSRTFGKGSVQTVLPLDNGDSIKLTTARYYTPSGRSIQASGIVPDIELPEGAVLKLGDRLPTVRERDLPGHLRSEGDSTSPVADPAGAAPAGPDADPDEDFAVRQALTLLKGLVLFGRPPAQPAAANGEGP